MKQKHKTPTVNNYCGITIHAAPGVHEAAFERVQGVCRPGARILDLGCGSGAFTRRLVDNGYLTTSVDVELDSFVGSSHSMVADFNTDFVEKLKGNAYDVIVALEVIEHLENPIHFLKQIHALASKSTVILISFPNIHHYSSLRSFLRYGTFSNYTPLLYWQTGHQTLLVDWLFEQHAEKTNFRILTKHYCGQFEFPKHPLKKMFNFGVYIAACMLKRDISAQARRREVVLFTLTTVEVGGRESMTGQLDTPVKAHGERSASDAFNRI